MEKFQEKTWKKRIIKGAFIGLLCGVMFFFINFIGLTFWKEAVENNIVGDSFKLLSYIPLEVYSYLVDKGLLNMHDAITAMFLIGIWYCLIFSALGCAIALLGSFCTKNDMKSGVDSTT